MQHKHKLIKIVRFSTVDAPEDLKTKEYNFNYNQRLLSKKIFDDIMSKYEIFEIHDIKTKKWVKVVYHTTNKNPEINKQSTFYIKDFPSNNLLLKHLIENEDVDFVDRIDTSFVIE